MGRPAVLWAGASRVVSCAVLFVAICYVVTPDVLITQGDGVEVVEVTCDVGNMRRDLWAVVQRFSSGETQSPPTLGVVVVGAEGSGSKLAALTVAQAIEEARHRSIDWGNSTCDRSAGVWKEWNGHGVHANYCTGTLVVHRSLPHGSCFPNVSHLVYDVAKLGFEPHVVVCTRDQRSALRSKLRHHQRDASIATREHALATRTLADLVSKPVAPTAVWSYETYLQLRGAYVPPLLAFLNLPATRDAQDPIPNAPDPPRPTRDGNADWQFPRRPHECVPRRLLLSTPARPAVSRPRPRRRWIANLAIAFANGREPAYSTAAARAAGRARQDTPPQFRTPSL